MKWRIMFLLVIVWSAWGALAQEDDPHRIIFMHHSTGLGVIQDGELRERFTELGYEFWDHDYNDIGLTDSDGHSTGISWDVPGDNTDPDGWAAIFEQPYTAPPTNTLSHMLGFDIIIFKSCFPSSHIVDDGQLEQYRDYYLGIRDVIDQHPDKIFVAWTTPPLVPNETTPAAAANAQRWAEYLTSEEYLEGHPNLFVFDVHSIWADDEGFLKAEYRQDEWDSHPNALANRTAAPLLVELVEEAVAGYEPPETGATPVAPDDVESAEGDQAENDEEEVSAAESIEAGAVLEDFEGAACQDAWSGWSDNEKLTCEVAGETVYNGEGALAITFDLGADQYGGCGTSYLSPQDWSAAEGIRFYLRSTEAGQRLAVYVFVADAETGTPFELPMTTPGPEWTEVVITWDELAKSEWAGDAGVSAFDPARVQGVAFDLGDWESAQAGTVWLDDLALIEAGD
jgi:hypothetical protein